MRLLALSLTLAVPAVAGASAGAPRAPASVPPLAADTILRTDLDRPPAAVRAGLVASEAESHVQLGLRRIYVRGLVLGNPLEVPTPLRPPATAAPALGLRPLNEAVLRWRVERHASAGAGTPFFLPPEPPRPARLPGQDEGRFVTDFADLALNVTSRMELGGDWTRFEPCDDQFRESCDPRLFPQLSPDVLFGVQIDGTITDRIHVDVDFDQAREFDAANRINIFYEGREDDLLRRLEVGDVTFNLPRSRFLTEGIPSGNFGFQAEGQVGPVDFQGVWAQQRGDLNSRVFQLTGIGDRRAFVQEDTLTLDDADHVRGQFFWLVDPTLIVGHPHIDALQLDPASAPPSAAPGDQPIQLYRLEDDPAYQQQVEGLIQADAEAGSDATRVVESGWFRYLQQGLDYFVHPSGLWLALATPLGPEEMLAVTYVTALGDTIGDYNPERIYNRGGRPLLRLLKASQANHQPGRATWDLEMHQIYRVSASTDVEAGSVDLTISLGELSAGRTFKRRPTGEDITFLKLFGLDEEAPTDAIDASFVYSPAAEFFADESSVQGTFVVFPTLRPFAVPPPIPSLSLSDVATAQILGDDANASIYFEEDPFERENAGRFRLTLAYRLRSEGVISSFSLGAFGIRDGSEQIFLGDRILTRGTDYEIDYDVGQVRLLEPDLLFAAVPNASIRATWEQRSLFQVSPTQVFGLRTHAALGQNGGIDLLGLYQSERSVVTRPVLGTEPGAALLGGLSGSFTTEMEWMNRALDAVPGLEYEGLSTLAVSGELAMSLPDPNTRDRTFVDDFDAASQLPVSLLAHQWTRGSAPVFRDGVETLLPASLDATTAGALVWQDSWIVTSAVGDSVGVHEGLFPRSDIDNQIRVAGAEAREPGLRLTFDQAPGSPVGWRSVTTTLATNGLDLTKTEFLEFYASGSSTISLVVDLGVVSEDAFFVDSLGNTTGSRQGGGQWGLGLLDQEADPRRGEIWNDAADLRGVWGEGCLAERGRIYRVGDGRANCTRGNGRPDSEDLDADGNLDVQERQLRYVVPLDGTSEYLERRTSETGTTFQLYRVPIRTAAGVPVGGPFSEADLRAVRHLRITLVGPAGTVQLARMRLVGSRWIKRAAEGILTGIAGDTLAGFGRIEVSTVSRVTEGDGYVSPPGVLEELEDPTSAFAGQGIEFNEKSLGLAFEDVPPGARAEVYHRFPQRPRNFLSYGEARLWVVAREGDFGPDRPNKFFLKVGSDPENFYLFRTTLSPPSPGSGVTQADWLPELRIDFERWYELRLSAEAMLAGAAPAPGNLPVEVWSVDSTYAVVLKDRGRAPNLAAVREISMGVWNVGTVASTGEIWVDELRLGDPVRDPGLASSLAVELDAAGVLTSRFTMTDRGAFFRQLRDDPTYQSDRTLDFRSRLALDHWMPGSWGLELPVTLELGRTTQAPRFLAASDVRADRLGDLRDTEERRTRVGVALRKRTLSANRWVGFFVDGLNANAAYTTSDGSTVTTDHESKTFDAGVGWVREPDAAEIDLVPDFADRFVRAILPGFLEDDVADARLRLNPERVSLGSTYYRQDSRIFRYESIVRLPEDSAAIGTLIPRESLQSVADVRLRPLSALSAELAVLTVRDMLEPEEAVTDPEIRELIRSERASPAGLDLGWETNRTLRTRLSFRPGIVPWLRNDFDWTTVYQSERNSNFVGRAPMGADTALVLERSARGQRDYTATVALDPSRLALAIFDEPDLADPGSVPAIQTLMSLLRPLSATYQDGVTSRFNRDPVDPGFGYQFGWSDAESFRVMGADTAATVTDRAAWTLGSGVTLPGGGGGVQVGYQRAEAVTLDTRSDRRTILRSWPQIQASLPTLTPPAVTGIRAVTVSSGVVRTLRTIEFGGRGDQRRVDDDIRIPVDVSIQWIRNLVTTYQGALRVGRGEDPTGETERDERSHRVSVRSQLLPPGWLADRLDRPISVSVLAAFTSERTCRETTTATECVAFLDQIGRSLNVSLDTSVRGFAVGLQVSFDDRQSFVGRRAGSTQFQVGLFGQLEFTGGPLPLG